MTAMNEDPRRPGGSSGEFPDGLSEEVRRRLHDAVADIQPAPGALERLRVAVPARRRRRRAAGATALATVAVLAIATPVVRTAVLSDQTSQKSAKTSSQSSAGGGQNDQGENDDDQESRGTIGSSGVAGSNGNGAKPRTTGGPQATATTTAVVAPILPTATASATASPSATATSTLPPGAQACEVKDLEQGSGTTLAAPGSDGIAYGAVEVRNVSRRDCSVAGAGIVLVAAAPGNPPVQVQVKFHEAGDLAVRLPSVAAPTGPLTVKAGAAYEFQFAWLPTRGTGANGGCTPGDGQAGPPPPIPSLAYMLADGGVKMAEVPLTPACGGVVYRTEVYPVGAFPRAAG